jgi:hypothetical protein
MMIPGSEITDRRHYERNRTLKSRPRPRRGLFEKFKQDETGSHGALFKQINGELETHTHIEETIFYPAAMKSGKADLKKIIREGLEEHAQVKALLAELSEMTARSTQFNAKLKVVVEDVEHHVEEEEGEMFPLCEDQMSDAQLEKLGAEMEAEKKRFQKANRIKPAPEPKPKGIGAMVGRGGRGGRRVLGGSTKPRKAARGGKGKRSGANGKDARKAGRMANLTANLRGRLRRHRARVRRQRDLQREKARVQEPKRNAIARVGGQIIPECVRQNTFTTRARCLNDREGPQKGPQNKLNKGETNAYEKGWKQQQVWRQQIGRLIGRFESSGGGAKGGNKRGSSRGGNR